MVTFEITFSVASLIATLFSNSIASLGDLAEISRVGRGSEVDSDTMLFQTQ
jgi:hypothetical protein